MTRSSPVPVVVIHSSCKSDTNDHGGDASPQTEESQQSGSLFEIQSLSISCDILILPELPNMEQEEQPLQLRKTRLNPCGISNVLLLENLLWKDVLLSLTSCSVTTSEENVLPVEPEPSTFVFSLQGGTIQSMSELDVRFDFTVAETHWNEVTTAAEASSKNQESSFNISTSLQDLTYTGRDKSIEALEVDCPPPPNATTSFTVEGNEGASTSSLLLEQHRQVASFYADMCLESLQYHHYQQQDLSRRDLGSEEDVVLLARIQEMAAKEAHDLDRLLGFLAIVGLCLFGLLVWSGYRLYRSIQREEEVNKIRKKLAKNQEIFCKIGNSSHDKQQPLSSLSFDITSYDITNSNQDILLPSSLSLHSTAAATDDREAIIDDPQLLLLVTSLSINRQQVSNQAMTMSMFQSKGFDLMVVDGADPLNKDRRNELFEISGLRANYPQLFVVGNGKTKFVGDFEGIERLHDSGLLTRDYLFGNSPKSSPLVMSTYGNIAPSPFAASSQVTPPRHQQQWPPYNMQSQSTNPPQEVTPPRKKEQQIERVDEVAELSPCSKLAKEWAEKKTVRRSNRKKKQLNLQPMEESAKSESNQTLLPPPPFPQVIEQPILGSSPPKVLSSTVGEKKNSAADFCSQVESYSREKSQSSESSTFALSPTKNLPELCSTPGSNDESFIDDYW